MHGHTERIFKMVPMRYAALTSKLVQFIATVVQLPAVRSAHHHTDRHFNQHHNTPALPTLAARFTPVKAFRVPTDSQNSVMLSCFDRDSLRSITSKMGWGGG